MKSKTAKPRSLFWLQGAVVGGVAAAMPGTALLLATLLGPALAVYTGESAGGRPVARTMLLAGSTAVATPLRTLWADGNSVAGALDLLADPACPLLAWIACGAGWLLCEVAQMGARLAFSLQAKRQTLALHEEQAKLKDEWTLA